MTPLPAAFLGRPFAHRALHDAAQGRPENSRAAIRAAIAQGYGVEIDLQLSRDGAAMVFHDYDLRRLTAAQGPVRQRSAEELGAIPLIGGAEGIPTFAEVLEVVAGQVPLLVELKDQHGQMGDTCGTLEDATIAALDGYVGPVALMSFNPHMVACLAQRAPGLTRGLVGDAFEARDWPLLREETRARLRGLPDADRVGAAFLSHNWKDLHSPRVAALQAQGLSVMCWTVRSPKEEAIAREVADNVTFEGYLPA